MTATRRWQRHFDTLGDRDPIAVLRQTPGHLADIVRDHSAETLRRRPFAGKWTPNEILGHLVDHEIVSMSRIRTTRFDDVPWLSRYDQERWVEAQRHNDGEPGEFVRRFTELRAWNLEQYDALSEQELTSDRPRREGGTLTLGDLICVHAGHDLSHLDQIARYLAAIES